MERADKAIRKILAHEGGFVDHPADPGGATNKGITIATYRRYIKRNGTVADLKALTTEQAVMVYKRQYWDAVQADSLPPGVDYAVADFAVNSGPSRAAKYLQAIVGVSQDGRIGPQTLAAVAKMDPREIINRLCDDRLAFMKRIQGGKLWRTFGRGWQRRVDDVRATSLEWSQRAAPVRHVAPSAPAQPKPTQGAWAVLFAALAAMFRRKS